MVLFGKISMNLLTKDTYVSGREKESKAEIKELFLDKGIVAITLFGDDYFLGFTEEQKQYVLSKRNIDSLNANDITHLNTEQLNWLRRYFKVR